MSNVFDYINSINSSKKNLIEEGVPEKDYVPFIINKSFSYFPDTLMHANELNTRSHIPKKYQYEYYLKSIRPRKRFSKWFKKEEHKYIEDIKKYYEVSSQKALEYSKILTSKQLKQIHKELDEGGLG
jgi:hypothetical protein